MPLAGGVEATLMINPPVRSDSSETRAAKYWCHACHKEHDGAAAGLIGEQLHLCQPGVDQYERRGILERVGDHEPPEYRLASHPGGT